MKLTLEQLTQYIDHTLLKPYASQNEMIEFCKEAKELKVKMVAINSYYTKLCKELLKDSNIHVGAAISFPLGQATVDKGIHDKFHKNELPTLYKEPPIETKGGIFV